MYLIVTDNDKAFKVEKLSSDEFKCFEDREITNIINLSDMTELNGDGDEWDTINYGIYHGEWLITTDNDKSDRFGSC